jgi:subtilisin family serine protease
MRLGAAVLAGIAASVVLAAPAGAASGELSVQIADGVDATQLGRAVATATGGRLVANLGPLDTLVFSVDDLGADAAATARLAGVRSVERLTATRRLAFEPDDPLAPNQWYLGAIRAFDFWPDLPVQPAVRVAVVDSGVDGGHPDLAGRVVASRSFVSSPPLVDTFGHGTIIAGEIAARLDTQGIAGVGIPVELLVAKVVDSTGWISVLDEARAIRWAVDSGAQVINLSLAGTRDPIHPSRDTYSALERSAIDYATSRGVIVVAAAGNCSTGTCPELYASYPAALPHVIGVGALNPSGGTPLFSNRDRAFVDLAAPGVEILSTYPRKLSRAGCTPTGYTFCARAESDRNPRGTSFSAPLVTAAAALVIGERGMLGLPALHSSQVAAIVERSAVDIGVAGRDARSGNGRLDVQAALTALGGTFPPPDTREPNDGLGEHAARLSGATLVDATVDRFDDPRDVYRLALTAHQRIVLAYTGPDAVLFLWRANGSLAAVSRTPGSRERIAFRPKASARFFAEVRLPSGPGGGYRLTVQRG